MSDMQSGFTAYLVRAVHNTRCNYTHKMNRRNELFLLVDAIQMDESMSIADYFRKGMYDEMCLFTDRQSDFHNGKWNVEDKSLFLGLKRLTVREQDFIFKRVCLELDFAVIGRAYDLTGNQAKHVYYYAISKMRRYADGI